MPSKKKPALTWTKINNWTEIAVHDDTTFVLTHNTGAGRRNRYNLTVTHSHLEPAIIGRELTPSHCRNLANDLYRGLLHCTNTPAVVRIKKIRDMAFISWRVMTNLLKMTESEDIRAIKKLGLVDDLGDYKYFRDLNPEET